MNAQLDSYALQQAALRARLTVATAGFPWDEMDDLRQDLLLDFLRRAPRFDATRGEWRGFVRGVMRHQASTLTVRRHRRERREVLVGDLGNPGDEAMEGAVFEAAGQRDVAAQLDLAIDVRRVLEKLPPRLQQLAGLLAELPVSEVCLLTGKSRSRIYQMIRQLRTAFIHAGLNPVTSRRASRSASASLSGKFAVNGCVEEPPGGSR